MILEMREMLPLYLRKQFAYLNKRYQQLVDQVKQWKHYITM